MSDQHNPLVSSPYGHSFVQTPTIQSLADQGVTFENAYCPSPLCVPSRSAFLTGLPVHQVGAWDNSCPLPVTEPTWAHRLNAVGYETTVCGRMSIGGPNQMHGFARRIHDEMRPGVMGSSFPDWEAPIRAHTGTRERLETAGTGDTWQQRYDESVTDSAVAYLSDPARKDGPWAAVVGWFLPHTPLTVRAEYFDMYYPDLADQPSEAGQPIDASATMPSGVAFEGPAGLRRVLLSRGEDFAATVTEKLLAYALGRGLEYTDRPAVRRILHAAADDDYRWSSIVLGIVKSAPFQWRRTRTDEPALVARGAAPDGP